MNISLGHKSRDPERDKKADHDRLARISTTISGIIDDIRSEEAGLRKRYEREAADASFLELAEESEGSSIKLDARLGDATESILRSEKRLETLGVQITFLEDTKSSIEQEIKALINRS